MNSFLSSSSYGTLPYIFKITYLIFPYYVQVSWKKTKLQFSFNKAANYLASSTQFRIRYGTFLDKVLVVRISDFWLPVI